MDPILTRAAALRGLLLRLGFLGVADLLFVALAYGSLAGNLLAIAVPRLGLGGWVALALAGLVGAALLGTRGRSALRVARELFVLVLLVGWGLVLNHATLAGCRVSQCQIETDVFRPLAEPQLFGLVGLHLLTVLAYAISRRRPGRLPARVEALVHLGLLAGLALQLVVALQFADLLGYAVIFPLTFPVLAPLLSLWLFGRELAARLRRRGRDAETPPRLAPLLAALPVVAGAYAVVQALFWDRAAAGLEVFTATCGHLFSRIPVEILPRDCHYLCTVAAQGHPWLVRPLRLGRRRGRAIVVNRQLAVANAFEDLLHTRWPRFGAWARRAYDRVGLPVSRLIRRRWVADLVFLAMKPLEWAFLAALLLLDPGSPEERIDRMYR